MAQHSIAQTSKAQACYIKANAWYRHDTGVAKIWPSGTQACVTLAQPDTGMAQVEHKYGTDMTQNQRGPAGSRHDTTCHSVSRVWPRHGTGM